MRRNEFNDDARLKVFRELAAHFQVLVKFPPEATEDISDEQFVRNVVCSVYKRSENRAGNNHVRKNTL